MDKKILVAYFSASGVTGEAAWKLAEAAGADIYEIKLEIPYTKADLDWTNKKSRSNMGKGAWVMSKEKSMAFRWDNHAFVHIMFRLPVVLCLEGMKAYVI